MVNTMSATNGPSSGARGRAGIAAATTEARHGLTFFEDSMRTPRPARLWPTNFLLPCGAGMPWTMIWMSGMAGLRDVDDGDVRVEGEPPAVACAVPAGEHQAVVGAERHHVLVADGSGGAPVRLPVRGVRLGPPPDRGGFFGGEGVGAGRVAVDEDDLLRAEPMDVAVPEVPQGAADGRPVGVVTAAGHQDTELSHARPPPRSSAPPRTATAR